MKRTNILSATLTMLFIFVGLNMAMASSAPEIQLQGETQTILGKYKIMEVEPENIENTTLRKFELVYENGASPITIYLHERRRCTEYIVRSNVMEIQYTCNRNGFGAELPNQKFAQLPPQTNQMFLSSEALSFQSRITNEQVSLEKALGLIACYYPELMKNIQNLYANK